MQRASGILMPIFSLPSKYGIGDFGKEAYNFVDFLSLSKQKFWQILPLVQTGYGNSPYSSVASQSFNPYFISIEKLCEQGLLRKSEIELSLNKGDRIDYSFLYGVRFPLLKKAFSRFNQNDTKFKSFIKKGSFLDYALFMSLKYVFGGEDFYNWPDKFKYREVKALKQFKKDYKEEILFWQFVQFIAQNQWLELKAYANSKGIRIIGDLPLYVALDSVDVWTNPTLYKINQDFSPKKVAGVPPDYFCEDGQLWGNPVYDYQVHKKDNFSWWTDRIDKVLTVYDYVRIDHFRGLDRYYEVEPTAKNARIGEWVEVPEELFEAIHSKVDKSKIIAEDLGVIDDGVRNLLAKVGYPGMKILSFAFNGDSANTYLPEKLEEKSICYTGTHDNDTLLGLISSASEWDKNNLFNGVKSSLEKMQIDYEVTDDKSLANAIIILGFKCKSNLFIMPMQDVLLCDQTFRINQPGEVSNLNWSIRFDKKCFNSNVIKALSKLTKQYNR